MGEARRRKQLDPTYGSSALTRENRELLDLFLFPLTPRTRRAIVSHLESQVRRQPKTNLVWVYIPPCNTCFLVKSVPREAEREFIRDLPNVGRAIAREPWLLTSNLWIAVSYDDLTATLRLPRKPSESPL